MYGILFTPRESLPGSKKFHLETRKMFQDEGYFMKSPSFLSIWQMIQFLNYTNIPFLAEIRNFGQNIQPNWTCVNEVVTLLHCDHMLRCDWTRRLSRKRYILLLRHVANCGLLQFVIVCYLLLSTCYILLLRVVATIYHLVISYSWLQLVTVCYMLHVTCYLSWSPNS